MKQRLVKSSINWKLAWQKSHKIRIYGKIRFQAVKNCKKRGSEKLSLMKTCGIVAHENLRISYMTIGKQTVHCLWLEFEKLLGILRMKNSSVRTFWSCINCLTGRRMNFFHLKHLTRYLNKRLTDNLTGRWASQLLSLVHKSMFVYFRCVCRLFQSTWSDTFTFSRTTAAKNSFSSSLPKWKRK